MNRKLRVIEVDATTAAALDTRAAEAGVSVPELLAEIVALQSAPAKAPLAEMRELDRQWAAIKAGEQTVPHENVVRWLDTWGTPAFQPWMAKALRKLKHPSRSRKLRSFLDN